MARRARPTDRRARRAARTVTPSDVGAERGLRLLCSRQRDLPFDQLAAPFTGGLLRRPGG